MLDDLIAIMLILALILSALNAITGTARSLHQMSADGHFPKFFSRTNSHGVPGHSMAFNVVCAIIVVFMGGAVQIYTFSNVGYLFSFIPVLIGYYFLRKWRPNVRRPYRLPEWMKYVALALAGVYAVIYVWGGPVYASCTCSQAGKSTLPYYFIGIGVLIAYLPLYWYRKRVEDKRDAPPAPEQTTMMAASRQRPVRATLASVREQDPSDTDAGWIERILLASEGRDIPDAAVARVLELARRSNASVYVLSIARVHGVAFGLPNPGLLPTKREWDEQRDMVGKVVKRLKRKGIDADGRVVGTRKATKVILQEAQLSGCDAIVMAADPDRNRVAGDFMWTQEPQRVRRRAKVPVFLVPDDGQNESAG